MRKRKEKKNCVRRSIPYSNYDIDEIAEWLEEMSEKGFHLTKEGMKGIGYAEFECGEPKQLRYCLDPAPIEKTVFAKDRWVYISSYGDLNVYQSVKLDAGELHSDAQVPAYAWKALQKKKLWDFLSHWLLLSLYCFIFFT